MTKFIKKNLEHPVFSFLGSGKFLQEVFPTNKRGIGCTGSRFHRDRLGREKWERQKENEKGKKKKKRGAK